MISPPAWFRALQIGGGIISLILSIFLIQIGMVEVIDSKEEKRRRRRARWGYIIGLFAVVFLWRAIWDWSELYFSSMGSFIIGLILVGIVAFLQRDHVKDLF